MEQSGVKHIFRLTNVSGNGDFSVFVDLPDGAAQSPAMLGSTERQGADLVFVPRFPLAPGMRVRAVWKPASGKPITALFNLPKVELAPTTFVQQVFSTSNRLPENQLNVYIHFSAPMSKKGRVMGSGGPPPYASVRPRPHQARSPPAIRNRGFAISRRKLQINSRRRLA